MDPAERTGCSHLANCPLCFQRRGNSFDGWAGPDRVLVSSHQPRMVLRFRATPCSTRLARVSVIGPNFDVARIIQFPVNPGRIAILAWPNSVVMNAAVLTAEQAGWPLHLIDLSSSRATISRSFGDNNGELRPNEPGALTRIVFGMSNHSFWAMPMLSYQVGKFSDAGVLLTDLRRSPSWFPSASSWSLGSPTIRPPPVLSAAAIVGDTLWIAARVPRPDWQKAWAGVRIEGAGEFLGGGGPEPSELYHTRIDVINLSTARLVTSQLIDGIVVAIWPDRSVAVYDLNAVHEPRVRVLNLSIVQQRQRR